MVQLFIISRPSSRGHLDIAGIDAQNKYGLHTVTVRLVPALFGLATVGLVTLMRRRLGTAGALSAVLSLLLARSTLLLALLYPRNSLRLFHPRIGYCGLAGLRSGIPFTWCWVTFGSLAFRNQGNGDYFCGCTFDCPSVNAYLSATQKRIGPRQTTERANHVNCGR